MATTVGLSENLNDSVWSANPQDPSLVQNSGTYLKCELSYCDFWVEISKFFVTMATGVGLTQITLTELNRQTPKNPIWRKNLDDISYTSWVIADFLIKFTNFCYHGNHGGSKRKFERLRLIGQPPKPPVWCKILGPILNVSWVIVIIEWKFQNFSLPWQQGLVWHNYTYITGCAVAQALC